MPYRFAIVGCGNIASRHAEQIRDAGVLAAVCDILPERAEDLGERYHATVYPDLEQLLTKEQVDVVSVCTPNGLHSMHAITALRAGCHVLCEKPMALSTDEASRMIAAAEQSGRRLFIVKQNRYNPPVMAVKQLLDEGGLGAIHGFQINGFWNRPAKYYQDSWHGSARMDGGLLFTQFSHFIDLLYWFLGEIRETTGFRANYLHDGLIDFEDTGMANIVMESGAAGSLHYTINVHRSNMEGSFTLFGEKGTVKIGGEYLNRIDHFSVEDQEQPLPDQNTQANQYGFYSGSMSNHHLVYQQLLKALADPGAPIVEAREGLKIIEMIEKIYASSPFIVPKGLR